MHTAAHVSFFVIGIFLLYHYVHRFQILPKSPRKGQNRKNEEPGNYESNVTFTLHPVAYQGSGGISGGRRGWSMDEGVIPFLLHHTVSLNHYLPHIFVF